MKHFLYCIVFIVFSFWVFSCSIDLSNENCNSINWNTLNNKVKEAFTEAIFAPKYNALINLDSNQIAIIHSQKMYSSFAGKNKFKIGKKVFYCAYDITPPYIFYEKKLYYCGRENKPDTIEDLRANSFCVINLNDYLGVFSKLCHVWFSVIANH